MRVLLHGLCTMLLHRQDHSQPLEGFPFPPLFQFYCMVYICHSIFGYFPPVQGPFAWYSVRTRAFDALFLQQVSCIYLLVFAYVALFHCFSSCPSSSWKDKHFAARWERHTIIVLINIFFYPVTNFCEIKNAAKFDTGEKNAKFYGSEKRPWRPKTIRILIP